MPVAGAVIGAVATVGGAVMSSKAQKKATKKATQAQIDVAAQNNALAREQYDANAAVLAPFIQRGQSAGAAANALLGLGGSARANNNVAPQGVLAGNGTSINGTPVGVLSGGIVPSAIPTGNSVNDNQGGYWNGEPVGALMPATGYGYNPTDSFVTTQAPVGGEGIDHAADYRRAFGQFQDSTGYRFRLGEGIRALDTSAASRGVLQSGAAIKSALKYGQNIASDEFGKYLNALFNQQGVGMSAAGAQAGVSSNYVNAATNSNNEAAGAISNAAILNGNNQANMWGNISGALSGFGANVFGSGTGTAKKGILAGASGFNSRWPTSGGY